MDEQEYLDRLDELSGRLCIVKTDDREYIGTLGSQRDNGVYPVLIFEEKTDRTERKQMPLRQSEIRDIQTDGDALIVDRRSKKQGPA